MNRHNIIFMQGLMCLVLHVVKGGSIDFLCALQEFELSPLVI